MVSVYDPPSENWIFSSAVTNVTDNFLGFCDSHLIMGDSNLEPQNPHIDSFFRQW